MGVTVIRIPHLVPQRKFEGFPGVLGEVGRIFGFADVGLFRRRDYTRLSHGHTSI